MVVVCIEYNARMKAAKVTGVSAVRTARLPDTRRWTPCYFKLAEAHCPPCHFNPPAPFQFLLPTYLEL